MPTLGVHCQAIMESRHMDVLEMDAASHTGVDDVRQIKRQRALRAGQRPLQGLHHRRSPHALDGGVQRLPEDPGRAARARQVRVCDHRNPQGPVTVLSRCQRFDMRRVEADVLMRHLANIAAKRASRSEPEALGIIARAAEGSVRDSLSLLDQAIAHAAGKVQADAVRQMLGLADRTRVIDLSNRWRAAISQAPSASSASSTTPAPTRSWCCPTLPNSSISSPA